MGSFSIIHWIIVLVIVLLVFGPKRLPDLAKALGESIREFKKAVDSESKPPQQPTATEPQKLKAPDSEHASATKSETKDNEHS